MCPPRLFPMWYNFATLWHYIRPAAKKVHAIELKWEEKKYFLSCSDLVVTGIFMFTNFSSLIDCLRRSMPNVVCNAETLSKAKSFIKQKNRNFATCTDRQVIFEVWWRFLNFFIGKHLIQKFHRTHEVSAILWPDWKLEVLVFPT